MAQFLNTSGGDVSLSKRLKKKERENQRTFYQWDHNTPICLETYLNMLGVSWTFLKNTRNHLKDHFLNKSPLTRTHGNVGKIPFRKTKMFIDETIREEARKFLENYAQEHGQPDPSQRYSKKVAVEVRSSGEIIFLPTETTYKSVHHDFVISMGEDNELKSLKYEAFRRLWHELTPNIKIRSPRSDLCDTCHKFRNEIHSCKDEATKQTLKKNFSNTRKEPN